MHPALDELIALRDGEASPGTAEHAAGCPECQAELDRLRALKREMVALPVRPSGRDLWPATRAALGRQRRARLYGYAAAAAAVVLAGGLGAAFWLGQGRGATPAAPGAALAEKAPGTKSAQAPAPEDPKVQELIAQSQTLEEVLKKLEGNSPVLNSRSAGAIADLQDRVALIDLQIGMAEDGSVPADRLKELWGYRVQLLASIVELHSSRGAYTRI